MEASERFRETGARGEPKLPNSRKGQLETKVDAASL